MGKGFDDMPKRNAKQWAAYFSGLSDGNLKQAWWTYGRNGEGPASDNELRAWAAVNQEMAERGLL